MRQLGLPLTTTPPAPPHRFDGSDYDPKVDQPRLAGQHERIRDYMLGHGGWRTLGEIAQATGDHEASVSAQLRHLRKARFGSYLVEKRRRGAVTSGLFEYRVTPGPETP